MQNRIRRYIGLNEEAAAMTDANTGLVKVNKMKIKFEYRFLAFLDQLQSREVIATTCFVDQSVKNARRIKSDDDGRL